MRGLALAALALATGAVAGGGEPPAWGRVPVFAEAESSGCERVLQRQLERYGGDLAASVNKLRDMANAARSPLVQAALLRQVDSVVEHWQANLATLEATLLVPFPRALAIAPGRSAANATEPEAYNQTGYDDIYQVLPHATRDWSDEGAPIRAQIYAPMVEELAARLPKGSAVLVPGSGLGRLAFELAAAGGAGFRVTGVEASVVMLSAASALLRLPPEHGPLRLYPFLHDERQNELTAAERFAPVALPDARPPSRALHLAFEQADFVSSALRRAKEPRAAEEQRYDAAVTCFLVDAVGQVEDLIAAIHGSLRPGGLWLNTGPLQFHEHAAVALPLDLLLDAVRAEGFEVETVEHLPPVAYRSPRDGEGMRPMLYRPVRWMARKM